MTVATHANTDQSRFASEGYAVQRAGLPGAVIQATQERLAAMIAGLSSEQRPEWLVEPHVRAPDWTHWLELCRHPQLLDDVAGCLGCSELVLLMSHLIVKPAHDGLAILWHQDNTYWPSVHGTDIVTVWLALDEVDVGNGCMHILPSSHAGFPALEKIPTDGADLLKVRVAVTPEMEQTAIPIELHAGEYSIHDSFVIHGSQPNRSTRRRAGYTMRYANAATVGVDVAAHGKPVYYLRGDGSHLAAEVIDLRPGRPMPATSGGERFG